MELLSIKVFCVGVTIISGLMEKQSKELLQGWSFGQNGDVYQSFNGFATKKKTRK